MKKNKDKQNWNAVEKEKAESVPVEEIEDYDPEVYVLTDEEGKEMNFVLLGTLEEQGEIYRAFAPLEDDEGQYVILKEMPDGDLETIEDDEEFDRIADIFDDEMFDVLYDDEEETGK